uniref:Ig-like domain-containing protein n=1 Tax=Paramormyrops kingsleyae TaxID=1676925 RepID=A0A3B3R1D7_9TELE
MLASTAIRVVTPGNVTVQSGAKATLSCEMDEQGTIEQVEWSRCKQPQVLVFHSSFGLSVAPLYQGRITDVTVSGFTIGNTTVNDSGDYCCILTTFPHGTIENRLHLLIRPPDGKSIHYISRKFRLHSYALILKCSLLVSDQKSAISTMTVPIIIGVLCTALLVGVIFSRSRLSAAVGLWPEQKEAYKGAGGVCAGTSGLLAMRVSLLLLLLLVPLLSVSGGKLSPCRKYSEELRSHA